MKIPENVFSKFEDEARVRAQRHAAAEREALHMLLSADVNLQALAAATGFLARSAREKMLGEGIDEETIYEGEVHIAFVMGMIAQRDGWLEQDEISNAALRQLAHKS